MKKGLVLAMGILVISAGLMFARKARVSPTTFTLATLTHSTRCSSPGSSFWLAGNPVAPTAGAGPGGAGVIEEGFPGGNTGLG